MSCNQEMVRMIDVLNKLQDKLVSLGVTKMVKKLPQIVVIGSQSAGKSSVLESFVGRDFLPRGTDIVTRRPLILQLKQNKDDSQTFAKFGHLPKVLFTDFSEIRNEIQRETDKTAPNSGISSDPISLTITSPDVLDLNLVDLPGMTKVPVGNQPENIETIVRDLIIEYIENENSLILAVTPANQDLSTSDAIKLAREVDPHGKRTIGVLTKLDQMDRGMNCRNILLNKHKIQLSKGFIGVINRSQKDIENKKDLRQTIADEKKYFEKCSAYKDIMDKLGISNLQKYLQKELSAHLFVELPALKDKFTEKTMELTERIEKISFTIEELTPIQLISNTIEAFKKAFSNEIGTGDDVPTERENSGANINVVMNVKYAEQIETIERDQNKLKRDIALTIKNIYGTKIELFVPNKAFAIIRRKQIELMRWQSLKCVEEVCLELESVVRNSGKAIANYPKIMDLYTNSAIEFLQGCKKKCRTLVNHKLDIEKEYLSPNHSQLIKTTKTSNLQTPVSVATFHTDKEGWINYNGCNYYFKLRNRKLDWYPYVNASYPRGSLELKAVQTHCFGKKITLKKNDYKMSLVFQTKSETAEWAKALVDNAYDDNDVEESDKKEQDSEDSGPGNVKYPIKIDSQVEEVRRLVMAYVKITEQTLKDTLPKLCQMELIDATENFVAIELKNKFLTNGLGPSHTIDDLVDKDPLEVERKELLEQQSLYSEALRAMNEVIKSNFSD